MGTTASPRRVWIDTDIIFNRPGKEVDDGLALIMALSNKTIDIVGISLIHNVDNGEIATRQLLDYYAKSPIPVYKGADDASKGPGSMTPAVEKLAEALSEGELTVFAIGPATNIANLLAFYPEQAKNIKDIVFCAGRQRNAVFSLPDCPVNFPDYNYEIDPLSLQQVIESDIPVTLSGYEASTSVMLTRADLQKIRENGRAGDEWVYQQLLPWITTWEENLNSPGFIPFDTSTIGHVLYPEYFHYHRDIPVAIDIRENDSRAFSDVERKPYLEVSYEFDSPNRVDFIYKTKPEYKDIVMSALLEK